jgi:tetratricopeptide (TPR) repeat protein
MEVAVCNNGRAMRSIIYAVCSALLTSMLLFSTSRLAAQSQPPPASPQSAQPPQSKAQEAMDLVKQGQKLSADGKLDEAVALYQQAVEVDPNLYDSQLYVGVGLDLQGKYEEARQHLAKAIALASEQQTSQALRVMAVSYAFQRNTDKAAEYERRAFDLQYNWKDYADAAGTADELARIYLESGDLDNAYQWYQTGHLTALKNPQITSAEKDLWDFRWEAALARISARRGQFDEARKHLVAAKAILDKNGNPDQLRFYPYLAGYVALYAGDYKTAIAELQEVPFADPFTYSLLAEAYDKSGDTAKAVEYYRKIVTLNMHNPSGAFSRPEAKEKLAQVAPAATAAPAK